MGPEPVIVVAHSDANLRELASTCLREAGYEVIAVTDGQSAELLLRGPKPPALLVADVALRNPAFYQLCKVIKAEELPTLVLIISSVHTVGAYKRAPTNLYGADACIEEHKVEQMLVVQVIDLLARAPNAPSAPEVG